MEEEFGSAVQRGAFEEEAKRIALETLAAPESLAGELKRVERRAAQNSVPMGGERTFLALRAQ